MNKIRYLLLAIGLSSFIFSQSVSELLKVIANSKMNMSYYFWVKDSTAFLSRQTSDSGFSVWHYTSDKKWQPLHNANAHDGFSEANVVFNKIELNKKTETISFGISNEEDAESVKELNKILASSSFKIGWYFWIKDDNAFLLSRDGDNVRIWFYTTDRKWQPIHNAGAYDGFPKAGKNINVDFDISTGSLVAKNVISRIKDDDMTPPSPASDLLSIKASDIRKNETSPELLWNLKLENKGNIKSYALTMKNLKTKKYHWVVVGIPSDVLSFPQNANIGYKGSKTISNSFSKQEYTSPTKGDVSSVYEFKVYAFSIPMINSIEELKKAAFTGYITVINSK